MNEFIREPRYVVLKITDIHAHLSAAQIDALQTAGETIAVGRANAGRPPFNAVVVEQDWPEFEPTWAAIEARMTGRAPKPAECEPVATVTISHFRGSKAMENRDFDYFGDLQEGTHRLFTAPQPCPKCADGTVVVIKEDANNYCRILTLLGMEEEGSPVEEVERLVSLREGMVCADCNDTGWLENREEGQHPCTCMTEAEPYQLLQAKVAELTKERDEAQSRCSEGSQELTRAEAVIEKAHVTLHNLNIQGGLGYTKHGRIEEALAAISNYAEGK